MHDTTEARVALHTRRALVAEIIAGAGRDHPYEVPCVIAVPIVESNPAYAAWIVQETSPESHQRFAA